MTIVQPVPLHHGNFKHFLTYSPVLLSVNDLYTIFIDVILDAHNLPAQDHLVIYLALCSVTFNLIHIQEEIITDQIALSSLDTLCMTFVHSILNTHAFCYKRKNDLKILEALQCVSFARE